MADSSFDRVEKDTPPLIAVRPKIEPSPSPPPDIPPTTHISSTANNHENHRLKSTPATGGDAVLVGYLGDGKKPEIALSAAGEGLPPDQDDKDLMKDVTLPGNQAPKNPTQKRLYRTAFGILEQSNSQTLPPARKRVACQPDSKTTGGHPNGELLPNSPKGGLQVFYTNDTSLPEEVS